MATEKESSTQVDGEVSFCDDCGFTLETKELRERFAAGLGHCPSCCKKDANFPKAKIFTLIIGEETRKYTGFHCYKGKKLESREKLVIVPYEDTYLLYVVQTFSTLPMKELKRFHKDLYSIDIDPVVFRESN